MRHGKPQSWSCGFTVETQHDFWPSLLSSGLSLKPQRNSNEMWQLDHFLYCWVATTYSTCYRPKVWVYPFMQCIIETWMQIEMVPGCQPAFICPWDFLPSCRPNCIVEERFIMIPHYLKAIMFCQWTWDLLGTNKCWRYQYSSLYKHLFLKP